MGRSRLSLLLLLCVRKKSCQLIETIQGTRNEWKSVVVKMQVVKNNLLKISCFYTIFIICSLKEELSTLVESV